MQDPDTLTLVHMTDVHLGPMPVFWPRHWNIKRILGFINFWTKRREFNDPSLVAALLDDVRRQTFDHIVVTGDLANIGMPAEHELARRWLERVGRPGEVTVIPGNHDIYAPLRRDPGVERWRPYMQARSACDEVPGLPPPLATGFPFVRIVGRFALMAINSAVPTPPAVASGRVGAEQCRRFAAQSAILHAAGFTRIVLIHHPPLPEHGPRGLTDAAEFERTLLAAGAELVIHGHNHRHMISWRDTATGPVAIVGAAAAGEGAYNLYRIERRPHASLAIEITCRRGSRETTTFTDERHFALDPAQRERII